MERLLNMIDKRVLKERAVRGIEMRHPDFIKGLYVTKQMVVDLLNEDMRGTEIQADQDALQAEAEAEAEAEADAERDAEIDAQYEQGMKSRRQRIGD